MSEEFSNMPSIKPGRYQHYKGKEYEVLGVGRHTEVDEYFVVYKPLYEHEGQPDIWLRPYGMFTEEVILSDGVVMPRFRFIDKSK